MRRLRSRELPGIAPYGALKLVSEIGLGMRRWASEKHFVAWLTTAPRPEISGGKVLRTRTQPSANRATGNEAPALGRASGSEAGEELCRIGSSTMRADSRGQMEGARGSLTISTRDFEHQEPTLRDIEYLEDRLYEFNQAATGISDGRGLGVFLRDGARRIVAAAAGHTWGETCELRQVWVAERLRRQGIGSQLLAEAEAEAVRRGCRQLVLTTHSFQAPRFYERLGFTVVSEVPEYPRGHAQLVLRKSL